MSKLSEKHLADPGRPRSKALKKEWLEAMTTRDDDQLLSLDCVEDQAQCSEYGITSYPTLRLFHHGKLVTDYLGPRTSSRYEKPANEVGRDD